MDAESIKVKNASKAKEYVATRALFVAPSNYGKSMLISEWIVDHIEKKHVDPSRVVLFSPTHKSDPSQGILIKKCESMRPGWMQSNCFEHIDELVLQRIYDAQKMIKDLGKPLQHYIIWTDDSLTDDALSKRKHGIMSLVATTGRHYNISTILSIQAYRGSMNAVIRSQMSLICIGRCLSIGEIEDLAEQYNQGMGETSKEAKKKFIELWEHSIVKRNNHGFLIIHSYVQYGQGRIQCGDFDQPFYDTQ